MVFFECPDCLYFTGTNKYGRSAIGKGNDYHQAGAE